jgi:hypothetical protein
MRLTSLHIRPYHYRLEGPRAGNIFLCMLAHYVEWHTREAWRELIFDDEDMERKSHRNPVVAAAAAERSKSLAQRPLSSPQLLYPLYELSTIVRNTCEAGTCQWA